MTNKFFLALLDISSAHARCSQEIFQEFDLSTAQPKILYILRKSDGFLQKDLAEFAKITPSSLSVLLENMIKKDLVQKEKVFISGGKRAYKILLTEKGQILAEKVYEEMEKLEKKCFEGFSENEREMIFYLLEKITNNLS